ncbi:hypothetical protein [Frankia sp. QA3]|uniref:hypothetical protein n=1 Tax=Frankia sp. QA3 TaxID=710111 RepID=UPI000269CE22|nr:hypothetical protein [Frankia sp. QA3]EIV96627.1 hypothetical protein FraQA3DRAFT_6537 [Frankia sp. QA3]
MDTRRTSIPLISGFALVSGSASPPPPRGAAPGGPTSARARAEGCDPDGPTAGLEWAEQLDALAHCLARMDALMAMLEADLDRHTRVLAALADPLPELAPVAIPPDPDLPPYPDLPNGAGGSGRGGLR